QRLQSKAKSPATRSSRQASAQPEVHAHAAPEPTFETDVAFVPMQDPLHDAQANAVALEFLLRVQAFEHLEQLGGVRRIEADAVVLDRVACSLLADAAAHAHSGILNRAR